MQSKKHTIRTKSGEHITIDRLTRSKAIRAMCTECMGFETSPKECTSKYCPLYPWRGKTMINSK